MEAPIKPILMSTAMMRANLDGLKEVTRRTSGLKKINKVPEDWTFLGFSNKEGKPRVARFRTNPLDGARVLDVKCPYGNVGDLLWVRENWNYGTETPSKVFIYQVDERPPLFMLWKPSIHMPRAASRMTLQVTDIRIERLEAITGKECFREGLRLKGAHPNPEREVQLMFVNLWNSLHKKTGWEKDKKKFVWVVDYKIIKKP